MKSRLPVIAASCALVLACFGLANAQSTDIVILDNFPDDADVSDMGSTPDTADVGASDAGTAADAEVDTGPTIQIDRYNYELPEVTVEEPPSNNRDAIAERLIAHVRYCIVNRTVDPADADVGFLYLVRNGFRHATLTTVSDDEEMHLSRFHIDVIRKTGDERPIDITEQQQLFRECIAVVPLPVRPLVTERVTFRIKAGSLKLRVEDLEWLPL